MLLMLIEFVVAVLFTHKFRLEDPRSRSRLQFASKQRQYCDSYNMDNKPRLVSGLLQNLAREMNISMITSDNKQN